MSTCLCICIEHNQVECKHLFIFLLEKIVLLYTLQQYTDRLSLMLKEYSQFSSFIYCVSKLARCPCLFIQKSIFYIFDYMYSPFFGYILCFLNSVEILNKIQDLSLIIDKTLSYKVTGT